ncbi:MAG TPA: hypothetical protein VNP04_23465 [Alphaproteobacteria bacterium]|nr:hypothetical protein [Alphaproteobacteria bacterium]
MVIDPPLDDGLGGSIPAQLLPTPMRLWRGVASGTALASPLLDEATTDPKDIGDGTLCAELSFAGLQNLLL